MADTFRYKVAVAVILIVTVVSILGYWGICSWNEFTRTHTLVDKNQTYTIVGKDDHEWTQMIPHYQKVGDITITTYTYQHHHDYWLVLDQEYGREYVSHSTWDIYQVGGNYTRYWKEWVANEDL